MMKFMLSLCCAVYFWLSVYGAEDKTNFITPVNIEDPKELKEGEEGETKDEGGNINTIPMIG